MSLFFSFTQPLFNHTLFGEAYPEDFIQNGTLAFLAACSVFFYSLALVTTRETISLVICCLSPSTIVVVVQLLSCVRLFATLCTAAHQASLSFTISWSLLKLLSTELVIPSSWFDLLAVQRTLKSLLLAQLVKNLPAMRET